MADRTPFDEIDDDLSTLESLSEILEILVDHCTKIDAAARRLMPGVPIGIPAAGLIHISGNINCITEKLRAAADRWHDQQRAAKPAA